MILLTIISVIFIVLLIIYLILNIDIIKNKIGVGDSAIKISLNKISNDSSELLNAQNTLKTTKSEKDIIYKNANYVNKNCTSLEKFVINDYINEFDLKKLAELNQIALNIPKGWYKLTLELLKELHAIGWDNKVSCIKEKYAKLEFYTNHDYNSPITRLISIYGIKSEKICQTCGEPGRITFFSGWESVQCRKHYLEKRNIITIQNNTFTYNQSTYFFKDITDAKFEYFESNNIYKAIKISFIDDIYTDNNLYISNGSIGYGDFLNKLPKWYPSLNLYYLNLFKNPEFCEICGYKAVYYQKCECCENDTWESYINKWNHTSENKDYHIKYYQIRWELDKGEYYQAKQSNYLKNINHKILFNDKELKEFIKQELEDEYDY